MTPKERFLAALSFQETDGKIPFMELEFHIYSEFVDAAPVVGHEYSKLTSKEKEFALHHNAEVMLATAEKAGHDAIRTFGGYWEVSPGVGTFLWLPDEESQLAQLRALKKLARDRYFLLGTVGSHMGIPDGGNIEDFITDLFESPEDVKAANEGTLKQALDSQAKQLEAGADGILNAVDIAFNTGTFLSPSQLDEFHFPYLEKWAGSLRSQGIPSIWHTDGDITAVLERTIDCGVSAIQCVDPLGGMDIVEIKKQVEGRLALIGNIDCALLQCGPPENIEREVRRVVEGCGHGGGFVLSACNAIYRGIPAEHYMIMVDIAARG